MTVMVTSQSQSHESVSIGSAAPAADRGQFERDSEPRGSCLSASLSQRPETVAAGPGRCLNEYAIYTDVSEDI